MNLTILGIGLIILLCVASVIAVISDLLYKKKNKNQRPIITGKLEDNTSDDIDKATEYLTPTNTLINKD